MKTNFTIFIIGVLLIASCTGETGKTSLLPEWKNLINQGQNDIWEKMGDFIYEANENMLVLQGGQEDGWLFYPETFEDFTLEAEFLIDSGNKSGIAFRYPVSGKGNPAFTGYKVNLDHNPDQQNPTGSVYNVARAKWLKGTKATDWNKILIDARGEHLKVTINDTLVTEVHDRRSAAGLVGFQVQKSGKAQFRNVKIRALEATGNVFPQLEDYMRSYDQRAWEPMIAHDNLNDWSQVGEASWKIDDGVIHGFSNEKGGFLVHKDAYQNFYLRFKFKIDHEHNSGIFIRHSPEDTDEVTTDNAIECNIYDHDGFLHEFSTGAIVPYARAWSKMIDFEDWNDMEIFAFEDHIIMYVNGRKSSEAHLPQTFNKKGNICIQGGIQVFNGNLPSAIYIRDMYVKNFDGIPYLGY